MKHKFLNIFSTTIFLMMILIHTNLFSEAKSKSTITVNLDGTGDYESIQEAINNTSDGDVVLVYPGTYYENVNFNGRNITLASRYYTTADEAYIDSTIIDGNSNGSCVSVYSGEIDAEINGFTITNGSGYYISNHEFYAGGGLYLSGVSAGLCNLKIKNNIAHCGGGICIYSSSNNNIDFINTTISNNFARSTGGGLYFSGEADVSFSEVEKSNIYLNYAAIGSDIYAHLCSLNVIVDTFTVQNSNKFYAYAPDSGFYQGELYLQIDENKINPINHDLYVNPAGDNSNSGLTPSEPLLNIYDALIKIKSDSTHPNTIHLAEGTYSPSGTGEFFAVGGKDYITIKGSGIDKSIFDAQQSFSVFLLKNIKNFYLYNMKLQNGFQRSVGGIYIHNTINSFFKNINLVNNLSYDEHSESHINCTRYSDIVFDNVSLNTTYSEVMGKAFLSEWHSHPLLIKCSIIGNKVSQEPGRNFGAISVGTYAAPVIINTLIADNYGQITSGIDAIWSGETIYIINSTIVDNDDCSQGTIRLVDNSHIHLINTILRNESDTEIYFFPQHNPNSATLEYCNVDGGIDAIDVNNNGTLNWGEGNIDQDPLFVGGDPFSYQLSEGSPCIDAGTPDTTGLNLPPTDLAGNPRIYNGRVDIGAYEYIPQAVGGDPDTNFVNKLYLFQNKPNPFKNSTEILFITSDYERVENYNLSIYNIKGQLVRRYEGRANNFSFKTKVNWDGKDSGGREVAPGNYFYKLEYNNNAVVRKMVKVK